jgi:signal transduction histidine kinase
VLSRWPIRNKLLLGITLLLVIVLMMSISSFEGTYAYREVVRSISSRATELPLAAKLSRQVGDLRVTLADLDDSDQYKEEAYQTASESQFSDSFNRQFVDIQATLQAYQNELEEHERAEFRIGDANQELDSLAQAKKMLAQIHEQTEFDYWYRDSARISTVKNDLLVQLQNLATVLPMNLQWRMHDLAFEVRSRYRTWIVLAWICAFAATTLLLLFILLCYRWVFRPMRLLIKGSRRVAGGDFDFHIQLPTHDEMAELANAMNDMTTRFRTIRDDLDHQVQLRTRQVVRSEQLASVGFLAAGVAHEINNPLASIALSAESLESRLLEMVASDPKQSELVQRYLKMIQTEAFRCKEITEKLLDFSRVGEVKRHSADLRELVQSVIEMVRHLNKYQDRKIEFPAGEPIIAHINPQEIKQVVLNLITNALDSLDAGGKLSIELARKPKFAEMIFTDNGCGMTDEVLKHLFEPFFTRKRGGQGTGLGLSIVYRIVGDHGGQIEATSAGPGRGSQFHVTLPLAETQINTVQKEISHRYQAA